MIFATALYRPSALRIETRHLSSLCCLLLCFSAGCKVSKPDQAASPPLASIPTAQTASASSRAALFVDVTDPAGIRFRHQNSKTPRKYLIETMGSGCAFLDYDSDGWQDILLLNNAPIPGGQVAERPTMRLYRNNRNGTFTDVTRQTGLDREVFYSMGVAAGDYDNDGHIDLYISSVLTPGRLYHNEGNGRFQDVTEQAGVGNRGRWGTSCAWVDYDRDGRLDLFICNYVKYASLSDDQPCFAGNGRRIYCIPSAYEAVPCTLYHNEGNGRFRDVSRESGIASAKGKSLGVTVWDFDENGWPDIFVACDTVPSLLFMNLGNGRFEEIGAEAGVAYDEEGTPHSGMGTDADVLGHDARVWLTITNYQGQQTSLYQQMSERFFRDDRYRANIAEPTGKVLGFGVLFFDYDNDGLKDIFQVNGHVQDDIQEREPNVTHAQPTLLFHNRGDGTFEEIGLRSGAPFTKPIVGRGCAWGDIDNDGKLDVLITSNNGPAMLWRNAVSSQNHWLKIRLIGTKSNRDGIGALITVTAGGKTQHTCVRSGSSYLSQSDLRAHFGLGTATSADVEIRWPSGVIDRITKVACDRLWTAREGAGTLQ